MSAKIADQPMPVDDFSHPPVGEMIDNELALCLGDSPVVREVLADIRDRTRIGIERYGRPLRPFNGRNVLVDLYQELLDGMQYSRQALYETTYPADGRIDQKKHRTLCDAFVSLAQTAVEIRRLLDAQTEGK